MGAGDQLRYRTELAGSADNPAEVVAAVRRAADDTRLETAQAGTPARIATGWHAGRHEMDSRIDGKTDQLVCADHGHMGRHGTVRIQVQGNAACGGDRARVEQVIEAAVDDVGLGCTTCEETKDEGGENFFHDVTKVGE